MTAEGSIIDILPGAAALLGVAGMPDRLDLAAHIGPVRKVAVLLVDGLGYHLLARAARTAPILADVLTGGVGQLAQLTCTMPSTTPTSLVSLGTGVRPGEHGVLGFTVNVPGTDRVLSHILWGTDPSPALWQPVPTVFERGAEAGVGSAVVLPGAFVGSGLTVAAYRGAVPFGLGKRDDLVAGVCAALDTDARLVLGYTSIVDTAAHVHGIASEQWAAAVAAVGILIERLINTLPGDTALLVTADHGGLDIPHSARLDLGEDGRLSAGLRVVAGEPRLRYLHTVPGATSDVVAAWRSVLGDGAEVLTRDEAIAADLFGSVADAHRARIGDVVVLCSGDTIVLASGHEPAEVAELVAFHGAATPAETAIPLIAFAR